MEVIQEIQEIDSPQNYLCSQQEAYAPLKFAFEKNKIYLQNIQRDNENLRIELKKVQKQNDYLKLQVILLEEFENIKDEVSITCSLGSSKQHQDSPKKNQAIIDQGYGLLISKVGDEVSQSNLSQIYSPEILEFAKKCVQTIQNLIFYEFKIELQNRNEILDQLENLNNKEDNSIIKQLNIIFDLINQNQEKLNQNKVNFSHLLTSASSVQDYQNLRNSSKIQGKQSTYSDNANQILNSQIKSRTKIENSNSSSTINSIFQNMSESIVISNGGDSIDRQLNDSSFQKPQQQLNIMNNLLDDYQFINYKPYQTSREMLTRSLDFDNLNSSGQLQEVKLDMSKQSMNREAFTMSPFLSPTFSTSGDAPSKKPQSIFSGGLAKPSPYKPSRIATQSLNESQFEYILNSQN